MAQCVGQNLCWVVDMPCNLSHVGYIVDCVEKKAEFGVSHDAYVHNALIRSNEGHLIPLFIMENTYD